MNLVFHTYVRTLSPVDIIDCSHATAVEEDDILSDLFCWEPPLDSFDSFEIENTTFVPICDHT